jgi:hypothetical protein
MRCAVVIGLAAGLGAQQPLWEVTSGVPPGQLGQLGSINAMEPFADYDQDGVRDLLTAGYSTAFYAYARILSGASGATLWETTNNGGKFAFAGDPDGDGHPDIAFVQGHSQTQDRIAIWSPSRNQELWRVLGPYGFFGDAVLGGIDVNGDGRQDFMANVASYTAWEVRVYNHLGASIYTIDLGPLGWTAESFANMGDMDGDGCEDFVMGCRDLSTRGVLAMVSGQTGQIIRTSYGLAAGDLTSRFVSNVGDIDGDQVNDYLGCSHWTASREMMPVYSGATAAFIVAIPMYAESFSAADDVDLDGVRDIVFSAGYQVAPGTYGRTFAYSLRDASLLWTIDNFHSPTGWYYSGDDYARSSAGIGRVPGSPYPAVAFWDRAQRIRAVRATPSGQGPVSGIACSSAGPAPLIGVRVTTGGARITVSRAAPGSLALLSLALGSQTSFAGQALPLALTPYGWTGCTMLVGPDAAQIAAVGSSGSDFGYAAVDWPGVQLTSTLGTSIAAQWFVLDPVHSSFAATAKHDLRVQ